MNTIGIGQCAVSPYCSVFKQATDYKTASTILAHHAITHCLRRKHTHEARPLKPAMKRFNSAGTLRRWVCSRIFCRMVHSGVLVT